MTTEPGAGAPGTGPPGTARAPFDPSALPFPVVSILDELKSALARCPAVILEAAPGAGKTTIVPPALLDEPWLEGRGIVVLEPRRLAARAAARRIAALLGEEVGRTSGYRTRLDRAVSRETRIEIVTEGILARRLQSDPELAGVGLVVFDEFHERHLQTDLALVLTLDVQATIRPDLRILVMSATLDGQPLEHVLPDAPRLKAEGRQYPVAIEYLTREPDRYPAESVAAACVRLARDFEQAHLVGDVLAFLPGGGEIARAATILETELADEPIAILPLYGELAREAQDRALSPDARGRRKFILATPVAESSLTIDGVRTVVDSGLARTPRFDPASGMTRLETIRIARANADQRAGRAGRQAPGRALRLWTAATQSGLAVRALPEITQVDLAPLVLELAHWGTVDPATLRWPDPPPDGAWRQAQALLLASGALDDDGRITKLGRELVRLPLHPRLGLMIVAARSHHRLALACDLAALLEERDIMRGSRGERRGQETDPDLRLRLDALQSWRRTGRAPHGFDAGACRGVDRVAVDLRKRLEAGPPPPPDHVEDAGALLVHAYPDRIAQARGKGWLLANGRGAEAAPGAFTGSEFIVAAHLDGRSRVSRIHLAAPLDRATLTQALGHRFTRGALCEWSSADRAVTAVQETRYEALILESRKAESDVPRDQLLAAFLAGVRQLGLDALPWTPDARAFQARVASIHAWSRTVGGATVGPDLSDPALLENLEEWLAPWVDGMARATELSRLNLLEVLKGRFRWEELRSLDRLAPETIAVPSGSKIRLAYEPGRPPVLAVKLQELFGLTVTPTVYEGRVAVLLHLLSPGRRPIQVTQDLVSFWKNTYPEVRKELFARYPRHPWPEDPFTEPPTRRAKPR